MANHLLCALTTSAAQLLTLANVGEFEHLLPFLTAAIPLTASTLERKTEMENQTSSTVQKASSGGIQSTAGAGHRRHARAYSRAECRALCGINNASRLDERRY